MQCKASFRETDWSVLCQLEPPSLWWIRRWSNEDAIIKPTWKIGMRNVILVAAQEEEGRKLNLHQPRLPSNRLGRAKRNSGHAYIVLPWDPPELVCGRLGSVSREPSKGNRYLGRTNSITAGPLYDRWREVRRILGNSCWRQIIVKKRNTDNYPM